LFEYWFKLGVLFTKNIGKLFDILVGTGLRPVPTILIVDSLVHLWYICLIKEGHLSYDKNAI